MYISIIILPIISLLPSATAALIITVDVGPINSCTIPGLPQLGDYNTALNNIYN